MRTGRQTQRLHGQRAGISGEYARAALPADIDIIIGLCLKIAQGVGWAAHPDQCTTWPRHCPFSRLESAGAIFEQGGGICAGTESVVPGEQECGRVLAQQPHITHGQTGDGFEYQLHELQAPGILFRIVTDQQFPVADRTGPIRVQSQQALLWLVGPVGEWRTRIFRQWRTGDGRKHRILPTGSRRDSEIVISPSFVGSEQHRFPRRGFQSDFQVRQPGMRYDQTHFPQIDVHA